MMLLAYTPFLEPLELVVPNLSNYWLVLLFPLLISISVVYRATKTYSIKLLPREALKLTLQIVAIMIAAAIVLNGLYFVITRYA
jgi:hypothetical protein